MNKLTPAVQDLVDGVMHLLHYKDDVLVTEACLPQLISMLNSNDPEKVAIAANTVYTLAQKARIIIRKRYYDSKMYVAYFFI